MLVFVHFLEELRIQKNVFKIYWPLASSFYYLVSPAKHAIWKCISANLINFGCFFDMKLRRLKLISLMLDLKSTVLLNFIFSTELYMFCFTRQHFFDKQDQDSGHTFWQKMHLPLKMIMTELPHWFFNHFH